MADEGQIRLTRVTKPPAHTRLWTGAGYSNLDSAAADYDASSGTMLWQATGNVLYIGWTGTPQFALGFRMETAGGLASLTYEYSKTGGTWGTLSPFHNSVNKFTQDGFIAWADPGDWAAHDTGQAPDDLPADAYWIRITAGTWSATAKMYHLLLNMTLLSPIRLAVNNPSVGVETINGNEVKQDMAYDGAPSGKATCAVFSTMDADNKGMPNMALLWALLEDHEKLFIEDLAQTGTPDLSTDAVYKDYLGYLKRITPTTSSPHKMKTGVYDLEFKFVASSRVLQL